MHLLIRNSNFRMLWMGQVLSQAGIRMYQIAILWWLLQQAGNNSGKAVGLFLVMGALPSLLFVKWVGSVVDRFSTQKILIGSDLVNGALVLGVGVLLQWEWLPIECAYLAGFLVASLQAFFDPAINKAVPLLVAKEDIEKAVAFQTSTQSLANFGGAVAGALLIGKMGISGVVLLNGLTYLLSAVCNRLLKFSVSAQASGPKEALPSGWGILDGMPFVKRVLIGFGLVNFFSTPTLVILPLYTSRELQAGPTTLGLLEAALWLGLLAGTFSSSFVRFGQRLVALGGSCLAVMGLGLFLSGLIIHAVVYMGLLFSVGFALGINNVKFVSFFQQTVDSAIKGRFFALMQAMISFTFPIAYFLFGALGDIFRPSQVCLIQGIGVMVVAVYFLSLSRLEDVLVSKTLLGSAP
ncbi:MAG: MFS transporter [Deltaproteobacteria bacterium]|nr:MFS transporter [Deltaproteobacteria bacterium]